MRILCIGGPNDGEWHTWPADMRSTLSVISKPAHKGYSYDMFKEQLLHNPVDHYDRITVYERHEIRIHKESSLWIAVPARSGRALSIYDVIRDLAHGYRQPR